MRQGRFAQVGTPFEVYSRPVDEATALFLGDALVLDAELTEGRARCAIGELPTDDPHASGRGRVMLRPEQLRVFAVRAAGERFSYRGCRFRRSYLDADGDGGGAIDAVGVEKPSAVPPGKPAPRFVWRLLAVRGYFCA